MSTDWNIVNDVATLLGERAEKEGIESLTLEERTVLLPWWAFGIIGNGGFRYFYEGATETLDVAEAFDALGLADAADACRRAHSRVPEEALARGYDACCRWMEEVGEAELEALFGPLDIVIHRLDDDDRLATVLAAYIRSPDRESLVLRTYAATKRACPQ